MAELAAPGFGGLLRQLRAEAGLTQEELAEAASLSPRSVSDLERGINLTARKDTARLLADALGLAGPPRALFEAAARGRAPPAGVLAAVPGSLTIMPGNLPAQLSAFIGRDRELAAVRALVESSRLVTVTGPGGIGKTRLAVQVAAGLLDGAGDGVWLVELAPVAGPELVARTVAAVLGVREEPGRPVLDTLADAVGDRSLLVVLDNAEHVLGAAAKLADAVMRSCPRACLLVTSREPLGISGEHVFRVRPLAVPPVGLAAPGPLAAFESVQLFVQHASLRRQGFALDEDNAAAVASVCVRLDGIPLALELAAARLGPLSVQEISSRLDHRFGLLTGGSRTALPRHQTLRALLDWSYDLLTPEEQILLGRLSVFAGGWVLAAAEAVTSQGDAGDWLVLDRLAALVDKSLVQADETYGSTRYRLLETVRHYAAERLAQRGGAELEETRAAHRDYYLSLVETAGPLVRGSDEAVWLDRLEAEFDNIRAALAFSLADPGGAEPGLRLAAGLRWFCQMRGHGGEVLDALNVLLDRPDAPMSTRARALAASCHLLNQFGDHSAIASRAEEAIKIARGLPDPAVTADALSMLCWFRLLHGDLPALADIDEAVGLARATGDPRLLAEVLGRRAVCKVDVGDLDAGLADLEETLTLSRATADNYRLASTLANLGVNKFAAGELPAARAYLQEACILADSHGYQNLSAGLRENLGFVDLLDADPRHARRIFLDILNTARITGTKPYVLGAILGLALAAGADGDPAVAATLHGVADELHEQAGRAFEALEAGLRDRDHARLRATLGEAAFEAAYARGRTLSQADAIALATAASGPDPGVASAVTVPAGQATADGSAGLLSEREREIVALLAGGRPTPRSPGGCSCRSTRSDRIWSGSGTRPAPAAAPNWSATPSRLASHRSPLPAEGQPLPPRCDQPPGG